MKFKKYLEFLEKIEKNRILYLPENFDWAKKIVLPNLDLGLPNVERSGVIKIIMDKINPIYIGLSDGSKLFFTIDEFNRIAGRPTIGKTLVWQTQRLPNDGAEYPSKITMCKII